MGSSEQMDIGSLVQKRMRRSDCLLIGTSLTMPTFLTLEANPDGGLVRLVSTTKLIVLK